MPDWFDEKASSVKVPSGWSARLYEHANRGQPSRCFNGDEVDFSNDTFENSSIIMNDKVSSYEVFNTPNCSTSQSGAWHAEYFRHRQLFDRIAENNNLTTPYIFFDWGTGGPTSDWPNNDDWGARFTKQVNFQGGNYHFHVQHEDGARVYLDGQRIIDAWWDSSSFGGHDANRYVSPGQHEVKLEYYDNGGDARVELWWQGPGALPNEPSPDPNQWRAWYFGNRNVSGSAPIVINEEGQSINHDWGNGGPGYGLPANRFSARFERTVNFSCGQYRFNVFADDGVRFWVDNTQLLDEWHDGVNGYTTDIMELRGEHDLRLEYYENGGAGLELSWERVGVCDDVPPTGRITAPGDNISVNLNTINIQAAAGDNDSGIDRVKFYARYNGNWRHLGDDTTYPYSFEWGVSAVSDQDVTLKIDVVDKAGNVASDAGGFVHVTLDRADPTGSITTPSSGTYLTTNNVSIAVNAADSGSGIQDVSFWMSSCGTGQWEEIDVDTNGSNGWGTTWNAAGTSDCAIGLRAVIRDMADNTYEDIINATLDRTPPTSFVNALDATQRTASFTVSWSGYDSTSDITGYEVQVRDGENGVWSTWYTGLAMSATYNGINGHTYYFRSRATDAAGNMEPYPASDTSTTVQTDVEAPVGSVIINNHDEYTANHDVTLAVSATDNNSVAEMEFAVWNLQTRIWEFSGWMPYATSHAFTFPPGDGWKTVWAHFRDNAGNVSDWATDSIMVDTVAPASSLLGLPEEQSSVQFSLAWQGLDDLYSDLPSDGVNVVYRDVLVHKGLNS